MAAGASTEIGSAYLSIVPSAKGLKANLLSEIGPDMRSAGQEGGNQLADGASGSASGKFGKMGLALGGLLVAGIGIAAAGIGAAISSAMESQDANAMLKAQLGLDETEAKDFGMVAGKAYAGGYGESLKDVNTAIKGITQELGRGSDEWLEKTTENVLSVSKAFDQDLGGVTKAVGQLMKNDLAGSAEEALDIITVGMQNGSNKADDLLDTFNEYSTMFRDLGIGGKEALGLISQGLQAGARDADTVADALKEFAIRAQDGSKTSAAGFEAIGMNAKEMTAIFAKGGPEAAEGLDKVLDSLRAMEDPVARNQAAVALFGTKAEDLGDALFALDPSAAVEALGKVDGAAQGVNDTLSDTASAKIESWKRTIETNVVNFIGNDVIPFFEGLAEKFNLSGIGEGVQVVVTKVRELISTVIADVRNWVSTHGAEIERIRADAAAAFESFKTYVSDIVGFIKGLWDRFGQDFIDVIAVRIESMLEIVKGIFDTVRGFINLLVGFITADGTQMTEGLKTIIVGAMEFLKGFFDFILGSIVEAFGGNWQAVKDVTVETFHNIVAWVSDRIQDVKNAIETLSEIPGKVRDFFQRAKDGAVEKLNDLIDTVRGLPGKVAEAVSGLPNALYQAGKDLIQGLINGIMSKIQDAKNAIGDAANAVISSAKGVFNINSPSLVFRDIGHSVGEGLIMGMNDMGNAVSTASLGIANGAVTAAQSASMTGSAMSNAQDIEAGGSGITVNVYGTEGQSVDSLSEGVINKLSLNRRL